MALLALSMVNLKEKEWMVLVLRHMRGLTQEETAEKIDRSKNSVQNWERSGLQKCAKAWGESKELGTIIEYMLDTM